MLPLSENSLIANSIANFVLGHPDIKDIISAYNEWVKTEQYRALPLRGAKQTSFCLEIFSTCLEKLTSEQLNEIMYNEKRMLLQ